jgi:two-component system sensor histidine kinase HydH
MKKVSGKAGKKIWVFISPWFIIGAIVILLPIFIYLTLDTINKQRKYTEKLLVEKGAALIRSFEAGARTGIGMDWSGFQLQKLLIETAQQPGIDYLIVTDTRGIILADSDPSMIGEIYGDDLDLIGLSKRKEVQWRRVANPEGADTFEVFRRFAPSDMRFETFHDRMFPKAGPQDIDRPFGHVIFVGLNMEPIEKARAADLNHTVAMGAILLLIGFTGIVTLMLAQGYQSTKASLSRVQAFSDSLVENMPIGLIAVNQTGEIISINQTAETILHMASADMLSSTITETLPQVFEDLVHDLKKAHGVIEKEIICLIGDAAVPLDVVATVLKEESGTFMGYVILFRDMTELKHLKDEVARTRRLASIGSLAAGIAHEIRNPLSSIKGFATYFKERYRDNPDDGKTADIMIQEVDRLNRVISQLLTFARPLTIEKQRQSLQALIRHSLKMIEDRAKGKNITVTSRLPDGIADVPIDKDTMAQALLNLFLNAIEAMDQGGLLSASLSHSPDGMIKIEIADTGSGIQKDHLERLFDLYFTTKPSGTGLGLPIGQKIIEAHDGRISIASEPGQPTVVTILLPMEG